MRNPRTPEQNRDLHRLLHLVGMEDVKAELVYNYTSKRTTSSSEMSQRECEELLKYLRMEDNSKHGKSRGSVRHYLQMLGYDYKAIDTFVKNIGSNNPGKKSLSNLGGKELNAVVTQVKQMY